MSGRRRLSIVAAAVAIAVQAGSAAAQFVPPVPPPTLPPPSFPMPDLRPLTGPNLSDLPPSAPIPAKPQTAVPLTQPAPPVAQPARP
jgi:hypothetical protein